MVDVRTLLRPTLSTNAPAFASTLNPLPRACSSRTCRSRRRRMPPRSISREDFSVCVYLVTDRRIAPTQTVEQIVESAVRGDGRGNRATMVQLRDKNVPFEESLALGRRLREVTKQHNAALIVNDSLRLAKAIRADGVHLGQEDATVATARATLGELAIVGVSTGTEAEAEKAIVDGADYIGVGCVFGTRTKADAGEAIGVAGLARIAEVVRKRIPVVAIGGIGVENAGSCKKAGAEGVAVVSTIMGSTKPKEVAAILAKIMQGEEGAEGR